MPRTKGIKEARKRKPQNKKFQKINCTICGKEDSVIHRTATFKCWDCRMSLMKRYQRKHNATVIYYQ